MTHFDVALKDFSFEIYQYIRSHLTKNEVFDIYPSPTNHRTFFVDYFGAPNRCDRKIKEYQLDPLPSFDTVKSFVDSCLVKTDLVK